MYKSYLEGFFRNWLIIASIVVLEGKERDFKFNDCQVKARFLNNFLRKI